MRVLLNEPLCIFKVGYEYVMTDLQTLISFTQ